MMMLTAHTGGSFLPKNITDDDIDDNVTGGSSQPKNLTDDGVDDND